MPIIASTLLSCLLGLVPSPPPLQIDVVFQGLPMRSKIEASAMAEVASIWAAYGVDIRASSENDEGRDGAVRLAVVLACSVTACTGGSSFKAPDGSGASAPAATNRERDGGGGGGGGY